MQVTPIAAVRAPRMPPLSYPIQGTPLAPRVPPPSAPPLAPLPAPPAVSPAGRRWQDIAAQRAGLDLADWKPALGFATNRDTVWKAYDYYRQLQLAHPTLQWLGMAYGIAPTFGAAFQDLSIINRQLGGAMDRLERLPAPVRDALRGAIDLVGTPSRMLRHVETTLLTMQQEIFLDMSMQHEAYIGGGLPALRELHAAGDIDARAMRAWVDIDRGTRTGDQSALDAGNLGLLWREQMQVIAGHYDSIRQASIISPAVTWLLTSVGRPAIPGAKAASDVIPVRIGPIRLPIPAMDISRAADRWRMIERDTWPVYAKLVTTGRTAFVQMLETPLDERIRAGGFRRLPDDASSLDVALLIARLARANR